MWKSIIKVMAATALFGVVHSALASRSAKEKAAKLLGRHQRNAFYRLFYLAQSVLTLGALILYARRLPDQTLYEVPGPLAVLLQLGRLASLGYAVYAAYHVGIGDILGLSGILAWIRRDSVVPQEPEAQGPALSNAGKLKVTGPFLLSRHPLNLAPLPVFWLVPKMTAKWLAFNCVATLYLVVGSLHEENRLRAAYGQAYIDYQETRIPFYIPSYNAKVIGRDREL